MSRSPQESHLTNGLAVLLELCHLLAVFELPPNLASNLLAVISRGLRPRDSTPSTSQTHQVPKPNTHVLAIRCLNILPVEIWDGQLGEPEMGTLMEGLDSSDDTIRRSVSPLKMSIGSC